MSKLLTKGTLVGVLSAAATLAGVFGQPEISALLGVLAAPGTVDAINTTVQVGAAVAAAVAGMLPGIKALAGRKA